jgi:hypothetical protein
MIYLRRGKRCSIYRHRSAFLGSRQWRHRPLKTIKTGPVSSPGTSFWTHRRIAPMPMISPAGRSRRLPASSRRIASHSTQQTSRCKKSVGRSRRSSRASNASWANFGRSANIGTAALLAPRCLRFRPWMRLPSHRRRSPASDLRSKSNGAPGPTTPPPLILASSLRSISTGSRRSMSRRAKNSRTHS